MTGFRKWTNNPRFYIIVALNLVFIHSILKQVLDVVHASGQPVSPWFFPFLTTNDQMLLVMLLGVMLLFCDAPFLDSGQPYILLRTGKPRWLVGQILYIALGTAVYFLVLLLICFFWLLPNATFEADWGRVYFSIAHSGRPIVPDRILQLFAPPAAIALSFLMVWLVGVFLGLLMFFLNMRFKRATGGVVATALVLFHFLAVYLPPSFTNFSPVSWGSLMMIDLTGVSKHPSLGYCIGVLCGLIALLIVGLFLTFRKKNIDVLPPI